MPKLLSRTEFRERCLDRDDGDCLVPWCRQDADEVHHIIERALWDDGGYYKANGASVCNHHHQYAETNDIPPHAFWRWLDVEPLTPEGIPANVNKWGPGDPQHAEPRGKTFNTPPHEDLRDFHKYPSSRHLLPLYWESDRGTVEERTGRDDTGLQTVEPFVGIPLVVTEKMDGGNTMLVKDREEPVRARNGSQANHESYDLLKQLYWEHDVYSALPEHLQVFGEWLYAKHSIHYGCDCDEACEDVGTPLSLSLDKDYGERAYFQVFGVFDTRYNLWLSWRETKLVARRIGFPTVPVRVKSGGSSDDPMFEDEHTFKHSVLQTAEKTVDEGGEGIVVRSKFPFHYGQFSQRLGKYVRPNHVEEDAEHWSHRPVVPNRL